jgi:hypothetical protein
VIEETDVLNSISREHKGAFADGKEGMKAGKGHTVYCGDDVALSRAKQDIIVVSFRVSTVAALCGVHFMPFVSLELPCTADIDPKVDCDPRRGLYFSQTLFYFWSSSYL